MGCLYSYNLKPLKPQVCNYKNSKIFFIKSKIMPIDRGLYTIFSEQSSISSNNSIIDSSNNSIYDDDDFAKNNTITADITKYDITKYYNSNC